MLTIDGAMGEGGGQILRSALGLSLVTGTPFRIDNIRAKRRQPGLLRQHLTAVRAAAAVGQAAVEGADLGSASLRFAPGPIEASDEYRFAIGTAGSTTLVLQAILPALLRAPGRTTVVIEGGTHNPYAPPFEFLATAFVPLLRRMGAGVALELVRPGFYPAGGGCIRVTVEPPVAGLRPLDLLERGPRRRRRAVAQVANLLESIARRELRVVATKLGFAEDELAVEQVAGSVGPGNLLSIALEHEHVTEVFTGFGQVGKRAERVAQDAVGETRNYLRTDVPVGPYLADQLLVPLALAGGGSFRTMPLTRHTQTNIEVVQRFLSVPIRVEEETLATTVAVGSHGPLAQ
ncbi:MAG: RNA 3'-terminal phosphate cyclase [Planctomycetota bacterium]